MTKKMTKKQRNRTVSSKKRRFFRSQVCKGEIFFGEKFDKKHDKKRLIFSPKKQHEIAPKASFTGPGKPCVTRRAHDEKFWSFFAKNLKKILKNFQKFSKILKNFEKIEKFS